MMHLKTINELFGFGKKPDDDIVKDILNKVDGSSIEFQKTSGDKIEIKFTLNEFNVSVDKSFYSFHTRRINYNLYIDDVKLNASSNIIEKLYNKCDDIITKSENESDNFIKNDYRITNKIKS